LKRGTLAEFGPRQGPSSPVVMPWFHVQFIARNALHFLCNNCRPSNVMENIHGCNIFAS